LVEEEEELRVALAAGTEIAGTSFDVRCARYAGHSDTLEVVETFGRAVDERLDTRAVLEIILVKLRVCALLARVR